MEGFWRAILYPPVMLSIAAVGIGVATSTLVVSRLPMLKARRGAFLAALVIASIASALFANVTQLLYDIGLSLRAIDALHLLSYLIFGFAISIAFGVLADSKTKWLLVLLVPVAFAQPILFIVTLVGWSINGFAP
jgi:hypothetical protein